MNLTWSLSGVEVPVGLWQGRDDSTGKINFITCAGKKFGLIIYGYSCVLVVVKWDA